MHYKGIFVMYGDDWVECDVVVIMVKDCSVFDSSVEESAGASVIVGASEEL